MTLTTLDATFDQSEFTNSVLRNAFDLWFEPEIKRRQASGALPKPFRVWAVQVLLEVGRAPAVFFNDQLKGVLKARIPPDLTSPIERGAELPFHELGDILGIELTNDESNAGHLTAILHHNTWYLLFDFRYNAARIARHLSVAREFLSSAEAAQAAKQYHAAVYNVFAAVELAAKSYLLMLPDERVITSTRHGFVATQFNLHGGKHGNVDAAFVSLFNELTNEWTSARYPDESLRVGPTTIQRWLQAARLMLDDMDQRRPRRHGDSPRTGHPA